MAITNNPALKEAAAPAPAPAATPKPTPKAAPAGGKEGKSSAFRDAGKEYIAGMTEDARTALGSKSNAIGFVTALGDPRQRQDRVAGNATIKSFLVVGFRFKAIEPVTYTRKPFKAQPKDILDVDHACTEKITVPAGEMFDLNLTETALLLGEPVYGGAATGSEKGVFLTYKESQSRKDPLPVLTCIGKGSVKEGMIGISNKIGEGQYEVIPEFQETFGALYAKKNAVKKASAAGKDPATTRHEVGAAFYVLLKQKEKEALAQGNEAQ